MVASPSVDESVRCNRSLQSAMKSPAGNCFNIDDDNDDAYNDNDRFSQPLPSASHKVTLGANQCLGITPYSIAALIRDHRNQQFFSNSAIRTGCANDVVAVVLSTTTRQAPTPSVAMANNCQHTYITLLIGDHSLPPGKCARVTVPASSSNVPHNYLSCSLAGFDGRGGRLGRSDTKSNAQSSVGRLSELQTGDVVRLNRLEVRHDYDSDSSSGKKREITDDDNNNNSNYNNKDGALYHHPLLSVACDLTMSWRDPAPGPTLARLCRIIPKFSNNRVHNVNQSVKNYDQCVSYELEWEMIIPSSVDTTNEIVMELANWYCTSIARNRNLKSTSIFQANQRCQRRKLRDITAPNLLSNIVVKVLRCEWSNPLLATRTKDVESRDVTHVTLSDGPGSDDILGLVGLVNNNRHASCAVGRRIISKSITSVMLQSMNDGAQVLLTHVMSQAPIGAGVSSLILVPTKETTAIILTPDHPYFANAHYHTSRERNVTTLSDSQELLGMPQQSSEEMKSDSIIPSIHSRGIVAITARLLDIVIDGVCTSFMEGSHWQSPFALAQFLIDIPRVSIGLNAFDLNPSYRSATLILDRKNISVEKSNREDDIVVHACGDAMKLLCLDVPVEDMVMRDTAAGTLDTDTTHHSYLNHVGALLRALCTKNIPIQWVLEQESECNWFVLNATIIEI